MFSLATGCRRLLLGMTLLLLSSWTSVAYADLQASLKAYKIALERYEKKRYNSALEFFSLSFRHLPRESRYTYTRNELRYYMGMCHYHLKQYRRSYALLQLYLQKGPKKERKEKVSLLLQKMGPLLPREGPTTKPATVRPQIAPASIFLGLGLATLIGGIISGALANGSLDDAKAVYNKHKDTLGEPASSVSTPLSAAYSQALLANILYGAGAVLALTGGAMFLTAPQDRSESLLRHPTRPGWIGVMANGGLALQNEGHRFRVALSGGTHLLPLTHRGDGLALGLEVGASFGDQLFHLDVLPTVRLDVPLAIPSFPLALVGRIGAGFHYASTQVCLLADSTSCSSQELLRFALRFAVGFRLAFANRLALLLEPIGLSFAIGEHTTIAYNLLLGVEVLLP